MHSEPGQPDLTGLSVFVMEDETLVLMSLEDILTDLGCVIVGRAMRIEQAEALIADGATADAAILDVNIAGKLVFPIAEALSARNVPVIFATGYGRDGLPEVWRKTHVLQKPYSSMDVAQALAEIRAA